MNNTDDHHADDTHMPDNSNSPVHRPSLPTKTPTAQSFDPSLPTRRRDYMQVTHRCFLVIPMVTVVAWGPSLLLETLDSSYLLSGISLRFQLHVTPATTIYQILELQSTQIHHPPSLLLETSDSSYFLFGILLSIKLSITLRHTSNNHTSGIGAPVYPDRISAEAPAPNVSLVLPPIQYQTQQHTSRPCIRHSLPYSRNRTANSAIRQYLLKIPSRRRPHHPQRAGNL